MTQSETLAYLAGFIDGEGTIWVSTSTWRVKNKNATCKTPVYQASISVKQVKRAPLDLLKENFGGSLYREKRNYGHLGKNLMHVWIIRNKQAEKALKALMPYLLLKKEQAKVCLLLRENIDSMRYVRRRQENFTEAAKYREELYRQCKALNHNYA